MKIEVRWRTEQPVAKEIAGVVSQYVGKALMPAEDQLHRYQGLLFEAEQLTFIMPENVVGCGIVVANKIVQWLWDNGAKSERMVEDDDIGGYACLLERRVMHLDKAMRDAIDRLKRTRSWLRDRRVAEIRQALESALAKPLN